MSFSAPTHPVWSIIRLIVLMGALILVLYLTATRFDESEIKTIVYTFIAAAGGEGAIAMLRSVFGGRDAPRQDDREQRPRRSHDSTLIE